MSRPSPRRPRRGASARAPALTLTHVDSDVGRGRASRAPVRPYASGPTAGRPAPRAGRRGRRPLPQIPTTDSGHRFRPQIPTAVPDRPPVCCVIRPRSRNKSRPSRCVPFRSEIARRHAGGPRLSRPSPRRPRRGASARAPALTLTHVDSDVGGGARPAPRIRSDCRTSRAEGGPPGTSAPTKDSDHRFRPQIPTSDPDHRFRPQVPTTDSYHRFRPQVPATDPDHRPQPPSPTAPPVCCVIRPRSRNKPYPLRARLRANVDARHPLAERLLK